MNIQPAIDYFLQAKRGERRSESTLRTYGQSLFKFAAFYEGYASDRDQDATLEAIDVPCARQYIGYLQSQPGLRDVSVATNVRPLKAFLRFMESEGMRGPDPFRRVKVPGYDKQLHELLPDEDFLAMLATCDKATFIGRRDAAILSLLYDTGIRIGELVNLRYEDVDAKGQYAKVMGKGKKERMVFFSAQTSMALTRHTMRIPARYKAEWLFTGERRNMGGKLTGNGIGQMLRRRADTAGVKGRVNPHTFRHTFATNYLRAGGDLNSLMRLMGHADLTILQTYLSLVNDDLQTKHAQFSPMNRVMGARR